MMNTDARPGGGRDAKIAGLSVLPGGGRLMALSRP